MTNKQIEEVRNNGKQVEVNGKEITVYKIDHDANGNPRYVTHFLDLGVKLADYGKIAGLTTYRAKWFGGGYVIQSYNIKEDLQHVLNTIAKHYNN